MEDKMEFSVENNKDHMRNVNTFVLFDTETTGLPSPGNNPRITELCFIALTREELLTQQRAARVLNKLLLCFNPRKNICHRSSEITGLYNDALEALGTFKNQAPLISMFLKNLPQPACLIAHNGKRFDFPLLISHLKNANEEVPEGILCADSLEAFRMFDGLSPVPDFVTQKTKAKIVSPLSVHQIQLRADCERTPEQSSLDRAGLNRPQAMSQSREVQYGKINKVKRQLFERASDNKEQAQQYLILQSCSEDSFICGKRAKQCSKNVNDFSIKCTNVRNSPEIESDISEDIIETVQPLNGAVSEKTSCSQFDLNLFTPSHQNKIVVSMSPSQVQKVSYSLSDVYYRTFGQKPEVAHTAEDDCTSLLKIIQNNMHRFPSWCDRHAVLLETISPMY